MSWIDQFYDNSVAGPISLLALGVISVLSWRRKGRQAMLALTLFLYARYLMWRGLYTLNTDDWTAILICWTLLLAEIYGLGHFLFFTIQAWNPTRRKPQPIVTYRTVDVFVTVVDEPLDILRRTLVGCTNQDYPAEKYRVYVLDDGHREDVRELAGLLGCGYFRREQRTHAKAGNLNHALQHTSGELIAVFDTDQVPTSIFLRDTVGFFEHDRVAIVQTPHHFYNPDIFQKNLQLESELKDEQSLFFRVLQAGRDAHNSAFFAGSSGIFRRGPLMEIGGFQTDTITEDIHTSMLIHAKGYESRYLNKVLSVGLNPETFSGYIKQRTRWAIGSLQMFMKCNPLTLKGLRWAQRVDYFGSVYYFLHGLPRVVCLAAPLPALWLGIAPVHASAEAIVQFFGSYFLASLIMMRSISDGKRNAFWGDVYETAMCFSLSRGTVSALLRPHKPRPFVVTPKGEKFEKRVIKEASLVMPHLLFFGLMIGGLVMGLQAWLQGRAIPGLEIGIFWGVTNLILLALAILSANELPQWRNSFRFARRVPCVLSCDNVRVSGYTKDLNEGGVCVKSNKPFFPSSKLVTLHLQRSNGAQLVFHGLMTRQEQMGSCFEIGVKIADLSETNVRAIIEEALSQSESWVGSREDSPGIWRSLWAIIAAFRVVGAARRQANRQFPRASQRLACDISLQGRSYSGHTRNISFSGLAVAIEGECLGNNGLGLISLQGVTLKVTLVGFLRSRHETIAQFRVDAIDQGEEQWRSLNLSEWSCS